MTSPKRATARCLQWGGRVLGLALLTATTPLHAAAPTPAGAPAPATAPTMGTVDVGTPPAPSVPASRSATPADQPAATATSADPASAPVPAMAAEALHDFKLRELEEKVITLKEKVFRSKTRLLLLKERILNDVIAEAKVVFVHVNEMGSALRPVSVLYHLDGEKIYFQDDRSKILEESGSIEIFNQNLVPGNHVLSVEMVYQGDSALFSYLDDYLFKLRANYTFYAIKGKITTVRSIGYQKGDVTYDLRDRPSITFEVDQVSYTKDGKKALQDTPLAVEEK